MKKKSRTPRPLPRAQVIAERAFAALDHFLHIEAVSGIVLLIAAVVAVVWANSPYADRYDALWHLPVSIAAGTWTFSQSLHFWINDVLMTVFFLVVGMEIRYEISEGALSQWRQASLPIAAAVGGVVAPALIYLVFNSGAAASHGWAVPTATDIAFAVGVLALLGRSIPSNVRILLLALAIIDDIIAVLMIAAFYSSSIQYGGFAIAVLGMLMVLALQRAGIGSAWAFVPPGAVIWTGLYIAGVHPTLAGVVLGLMTPAAPLPMRASPLSILTRRAEQIDQQPASAAKHLTGELRELRAAQRELLPPVIRVQTALHPWVAYVVMPLFALANAGVAIGTDAFADPTARWVIGGIAVALVFGKPLGVMLAGWLCVRLGVCELPPGVGWGGVLVVGLLAGIGFTMSIFIAMLAFDQPSLLDAAKLGILLGSLVAALAGLGWGALHGRSMRRRGVQAV